MIRKRNSKVLAPLTRKPIDVPLPEGVPLEGDAIFVRLLTLAALEEFWEANRDIRPYCAEGTGMGNVQNYLNAYDWVFAPAKPAVVKAVARWNIFGIRCEWYDWAGLDNYTHELFFSEREDARREKRGTDNWSTDDEEDYQRWTRETYTGWWTLANLPGRESGSDWLDFQPEIRDKDLAVEDVEILLQEQIFNGGTDWRMSAMGYEVQFHEAWEVDNMIVNSRNQRSNGDLYYGCENDRSWAPPPPFADESGL